MTSTSVWDDPDVKAGGEFVKFEDVGDSVSGVVNAIRTHRFDDGKVVPQILLTTDDGEEKTMSAGQVRLKAELAAQRPEAGDHLSVKLSEVEKRSGGKTLKHFEVVVTRGGKPATGSAPTGASSASQPATSGAIDPAAAAAALANLSPEERAKLGL